MKAAIRSFLGLTNFYRRFIHKYADIAESLTRLMRDDASFEWADEQETTFEKLKTTITTAPVLRMPDWTKLMLVISTDTSKIGISGILAQLDEEKFERPVAFFSRKLTDASLLFLMFSLVTKNYILNYSFEMIANFSASNNLNYFILFQNTLNEAIL